MIAKLLAAALSATLLACGAPTSNAATEPAISAQWLDPTCEPRVVKVQVSNPHDGPAEFKVRVTYAFKYAAYTRTKFRRVSVQAESTRILKFKPRWDEAQVGVKITYVYGTSSMVAMDSSIVALDC